MSKDMYIVVDVETSGRVPGPRGSLLTLGAVAVPRFNASEFAGNRHFYERLEYDPLCSDEATMSWWYSVRDGGKEGRASYEEAFLMDRVRYSAECVMFCFKRWVEYWRDATRADHAIFVAGPASFDYAWISHAFETTLGSDQNPFSHRTLDVRSLIFGTNLFPGKSYTEINSETLSALIPNAGTKHDHNALEDAKHLAAAFVKVMDERGLW